jgi:hypothetical protein
MKQILLDLNAATIDMDPRKNLTRRYERTLSYLTSDDLEFVSTDSICFSVGIDQYKRSKKEQRDIQEFVLIAGSNYDSTLPDGTIIDRNKKMTNCFYKLKDIVTSNKVDESSPDIIKNIYSYVKNPANNIKTEQDWFSKI